MSAAALRFAKGQALGNDYIVVVPAEERVPFTRDLAVRLCDRHYGAGSDGVLVAHLDARPFALQIINPDGSEAEKSGNGLRIFGAFLHRRGLVPTGEWFDVRLARDDVALCVEAELEPGTLLIRARMGTARFAGAEVGFTPEHGEALGYELALPDGQRAAINTVSLGNPHCVVFVTELDRADFLARAPQLCTHAAFARGTNVQFARVIGPREMEAWIWERGAGETLASGSSACAVAAAAVRSGFVQHGPLEVLMPGGSLEVNVRTDYSVELLGPARIVYHGEFML